MLVWDRKLCCARYHAQLGRCTAGACKERKQTCVAPEMQVIRVVRLIRIVKLYKIYAQNRHRLQVCFMGCDCYSFRGAVLGGGALHHRV